MLSNRSLAETGNTTRTTNSLLIEPQDSKWMPRSSDAAKAGIGFGTALAIAISWSANYSILWAIIHGILSWVYVIYYAIRY